VQPSSAPIFCSRTIGVFPIRSRTVGYWRGTAGKPNRRHPSSSGCLVTINATVEAASVPWRPLGELFVGRGLITEAELETALAEQAATGKRLGEILVDRGLVSGPDLTDALMDQLGTEISKEEGFGSGLWAEIKRRHRRVHSDGTFEDEEGEAEPRPTLTAAIADARQAFEERTVEEEPEEPFEPEPAVEAPVAAVDQVEFERELEEIATDYSPPPIEPEPVVAFVPVPEPEPVVEPEPEPVPVVAVVPDPEPEPVAVHSEPEPEPEPVPSAPGDDADDLRAELDAARQDLAQLHEMLADAMTALAALTAEAQGVPYEG